MTNELKEFFQDIGIKHTGEILFIKAYAILKVKPQNGTANKETYMPKTDIKTASLTLFQFIYL